jgi:hypothetical protein
LLCIDHEDGGTGKREMNVNPKQSSALWKHMLHLRLLNHVYAALSLVYMMKVGLCESAYGDACVHISYKSQLALKFNLSEPSMQVFPTRAATLYDVTCVIYLHV